jgi:hypothetical protein
MTDLTDIEAAFDAALQQVRSAIADGMMTLEGASAREHLEQLAFRLQSERAKAVQRGSVDIDWVQKTIRWIVEWTPESDIKIIAALGRIARLASPGLS